MATKKVLTKCVLGDRLLHPTNYIGAFDLKGRDFTLTIDGIEFEELTMQGGIKDTKPVIRFKEAKKKLIVNKTNASSIAAVTGTKHAEQWVGHKITLYPTKTAVGRNKEEDCVRVRETKPRGNVTDQPPMDDPLPVESREPEEGGNADWSGDDLTQ